MLTGVRVGSRLWPCATKAAVAAVGITFFLLPGSAAASGPVPSCSWTPASYVGTQVDDPVRLSQPGPYNGSLFCNYYEIHRKLSLQGQDTYLVWIQYTTFASFTIASGATPVPGLGNCSQGCPSNKAAWLTVTKGYPDTGKPSKTMIVTQEELNVQDGSNSISLGIRTPLGSLKGNETADIEAIARKVLPRFYDNA
jgi:hypothetical protein